MALELRVWRQFVALAEELHFGRAARRLHMTQPPLTQAVQQLERSLGVALFDRNRRSVALTPAGAALLAPVRRLLAAADELPRTAQAAAAGLAGQLRLAFVSSIAYGPLPDWLRGFRASHPDVTLQLREATLDVQLAAFDADEIDAGFVLHAPGALPSGFDALRVLAEPLVMALPERHPALALLGRHPAPALLDRHPAPASPDQATAQARRRGAGASAAAASKGPAEAAGAAAAAGAGAATATAAPASAPLALRLADVAAEPLVIFPREIAPSLYDAVLAAYRRHGATPLIAQEAIQMQTIVNLVSAGMGVAWVPEAVTRLQRPGVVYRPVAEADLACETSLVWRAKAPPVVARFVAHVRGAA